MAKSKAVVIVSGGMDSVTLAYLLAADGYDLHLLSFDYGQRHRKELDFAAQCAQDLNVDQDVIDLSALGPLLSGSALTDGAVPVPEGHYAAPSMAQTIVPNRNAVMLSIAYAVAIADDAALVAYAAHGGDHFIYPDCRPGFVEAFHAMQQEAHERHPDLYAPFLHLTKADIVETGDGLGVPYAKTWSCYKGGAKHCGKCGTCVERKEAFELAGVDDPTEYEEPLP